MLFARLARMEVPSGDLGNRLDCDSGRDGENGYIPLRIFEIIVCQIRGLMRER